MGTWVMAAFLVGMATSAFAGKAEDLIAGLRKECRGCDLTGVSFKKANLEGVDLTGAILIDASFHRANLRGAILDGVKASGANFNLVEAAKTSFKGADLSLEALKAERGDPEKRFERKFGPSS